MIIFEGSDLVGKTTLAQRVIADSLDYVALNYIHYSRLPDSHDRFADYLVDMRANNVLDRFYMSEPVYAAVRGDTTKQLPWHSIALDREALAQGALIVVVTAEPDVIKSRYWLDPDREMYSLDKIIEANRHFFAIAQCHEWMGYNFHVDMHLHISDANQLIDTFAIVRAHQLTLNRGCFLRTTREVPKPC